MEISENFTQDLALQYQDVSLHKAYIKYFDEVLSSNNEKIAFESIETTIQDFESEFDKLFEKFENDLINEIESLRNLGFMKY